MIVWGSITPAMTNPLLRRVACGSHGLLCVRLATAWWHVSDSLSFSGCVLNLASTRRMHICLNLSLHYSYWELSEAPFAWSRWRAVSGAHPRISCGRLRRPFQSA